MTPTGGRCLGWAIRNRGQFKLLLDGFLAYAPGEAAGFYELVSAHEGDLADLLQILPLEKVAAAWTKRGAGEEPVEPAHLLAEFDRCLSNLRQAAAQYFSPDQLILANYNKAKHGAPIIRAPSLANEDFYVLSPQRDPREASRYTFSKFSADSGMVTRVAGNVVFVSKTTRALVSLTRNLRALDLL